MEVWAGCAFPEDVVYDLDSDTWVRELGDGVVEVGMTDVSQSRSGRLVQIGWKDSGRRVVRGRPLCVIESAKWVGPMRSPLTGVLVADNRPAFEADIAVANRDPYGLGWFVRIEMESPEELAGLAEAGEAFEHYRRIIDETGLRCFRCAD
ncbi:MAG: hypothetical protein M0Z34_07295 [Nitrospiraceae bacterium]|nr:hypothetical protein [Nitrospiraceae bacterium]MDA8209860.1 glycine cleavage system protein H [Actinomycetota bacterium]